MCSNNNCRRIVSVEDEVINWNLYSLLVGLQTRNQCKHSSRELKLELPCVPILPPLKDGKSTYYRNTFTFTLLAAIFS